MPHHVPLSRSRRLSDYVTQHMHVVYSKRGSMVGLLPNTNARMDTGMSHLESGRWCIPTGPVAEEKYSTEPLLEYSSTVCTYTVHTVSYIQWTTPFYGS